MSNLLNNFALLIIFLTSTPLCSASDIVCPPHPIRLAYIDINILYSDNGRHGIDVEIVKELQARTGCKFEVSLLPRLRALKQFELHNIDAITGALRTDEREKMGFFIPYLQARLIFFGNSQFPVEIKSADNLFANKSLKVGIVRGFKYGPKLQEFIDSLRNENRIVEVDNVQQLLIMLRANRFSLVIANNQVFDLTNRETDLSNIRAINLGIEDKHYINFMFSKNTFDESDIELWRREFQKMMIDGTMLKIIKRYVPKDEVEKALVKKQIVGSIEN